MAKVRTEYQCQQCGGRSTRWMGRCPHCEAWNSLQESIEPAVSRGAASARPGLPSSQPRRLRDLETDGFERLPVPIEEFARVLGGGIVRGSVVLVGGDPGVGKSTLLMQVSDAVARLNGPALYVSGEESLGQVGLRARRLGLDAPDLLVLSDTDLASILQHIEATAPGLVVIDSIQSVFDRELEAAPGSVSQLRECTLRFAHLAKGSGIPIFLIGHVTKEGAIAGPKVLEHMVDAVLYLEGERFQAYRLLRSSKNRFGPTHEVGVFEMQGEGMVEVSNPSAAFLAERGEAASGSVVVVTLEGTRPILVEVQALVNRSGLAVPRRVSNGMGFNRLLLVNAVLSRRLSVPLHDHDIYLNVVGGMRIDEPAADLGAALAILSSFRDTPIDSSLVALGEVGLSGELRSVGQLDKRLKEAAKLGFERALVPRTQHVAQLKGLGLDLQPVRTLREAAKLALGG
ncbi:MAG: DNA repair protein RadA [Chloroflexi bacterium]|nr:DNA repair protein RadA [Chloroflexota bacterium]